MNDFNGKPRVLLIEDDQTICKLLTLRFRDDFEMHSLPSAEGWLQEFDDFRPEVIILDILLPRMNGIELCRRIREHPHGKNLPILLLSAASLFHIQAGLRAGANRFLAKPFDAEILKCILRELLIGSWTHPRQAVPKPC